MAASNSDLGVIRATKVLIVDDNATFRQSFRESLRKVCPSIDIQEAEDGNKCLGKVGIFRPDLIFMDIRLPGENGLSLTKKIKEKYPEIQVITISSFDNPEYRDTSLKYGASRFYSKDSLNPEEIRVFITSISSGNPRSPEPSQSAG